MRAPVYSHLTYDVLPGEHVTIDRPDILIFEGLNVLQPRDLPKDGKFVPFLSDFFDFSIYIDAEEDLIHDWYVARFMRLRETAFRNPASFFHRYSELSEDAARAIAEGLWANINLKNLRENIRPTQAARRPHPAQGRRPSGGGSGAEEALNSSRAQERNCDFGLRYSPLTAAVRGEHEGADDEDNSRTCRRDGTFDFGRIR